jgi:hypothetical protein
MLTHMPKAELNHSNNPTYLNFGQTGTIGHPQVGEESYAQNNSISLTNIVKTNFEDPPGEFQKTTYISKVGIYDKYRNLIGIAKLATPVRKRETDQFTLKLKLDF